MHLIDSFTAKSKDGKTFVIETWQSQVDAGTRDNPSATIPGMKELRTSDDLPVSRNDDGSFTVIDFFQSIIVFKI